MKQFFTRIFLFTASLLIAAKPAEAQFLKKLFGGDDKPKKQAPRAVAPKKQTAAPGSEKKKETAKAKNKPQEFSYPASELKDRYRVDVLASLYLDELVKNGRTIYKDHIPDKALPGLNFYEGIRLATDTLRQLGYDLDVYIHDITDPLSGIETLINSGSLDSSDLIIGGVQGIHVGTLAAFAKKRRINFVSTLSPADAGVKDNPFFTLLQPTLQTHCARIRKAVASQQGRKKVLVYHRNTIPVDENAFREIAKGEGARFTPVNCNSLPSADQLFLLLDSSETNIVIIPVLDNNYASQLLRQLSDEFPSYHFEVYGMPSWKNMPALKKQDTLSNIAITISEPFYFDVTTSAGQSLLNDYRKVYGGRASEMVFRGYETIYWYAYLLRKYGTMFNNHTTDNAAAAFTRIEIGQKKDEEENLLYNENEHVYLVRYSDGAYTVDQ